MFKETDNGQTQYCPMCEEWAKKYERLEAENEELKKELELNTANAVVIDMTERLHKYKQALEDIKTELLQNSCANSKEITNVLAIIDEVLNERI